MSGNARKRPGTMIHARPLPPSGPCTVERFLDAGPPGHELIDGRLVPLRPFTAARAELTRTLARRIGGHLDADPAGGVRRLVIGAPLRRHASRTCLIADLAVMVEIDTTILPTGSGPGLAIEVLSGGWDDSLALGRRLHGIYPLREIVVFHVDLRLAEVWRQRRTGPYTIGLADSPAFEARAVRLETIGLTINFDEAYRDIGL